MTEIAIQLQDDRTDWFPAEELAGTVRWQLDSPPEQLELRLFWFTRGKGTQDVDVIQRVSVPAPGMSGEHDFRFRLPLEPYSVSGKLLSLVWSVECVADPGEASGRAEFNLSHLGHELVLGSIEDPEEANVPPFLKGVAKRFGRSRSGDTA